MQGNAVIVTFSRWNYATPVRILTFQQFAMPAEVADLDLKESVPDLKPPISEVLAASNADGNGIVTSLGNDNTQGR